MLLIKIEQQDLLCDGKNNSDSVNYFARVHMITQYSQAHISKLLWANCKRAQN